MNPNITQKMKFSITNFFSKFDQIRNCSHLLKKSVMENFIFCAAQCVKKFYYLRENSKYPFGVGTNTKLEERF